jgi:hypothetical protein
VKQITPEIMYKANVTINGGVIERSVLLGNIGAALSTDMLLQNGITSILSVLDFESMGSSTEELKKMKRIFHSGGASSKLQKTVVRNDRVFHLLHVADVSSPDILINTHKLEPSQLLCEAVAWINESLKYGNVLVRSSSSSVFFFRLLLPSHLLSFS